MYDCGAMESVRLFGIDAVVVPVVFSVNGLAKTRFRQSSYLNCWQSVWMLCYHRAMKVGLNENRSHRRCKSDLSIVRGSFLFNEDVALIKDQVIMCVIEGRMYGEELI